MGLGKNWTPTETEYLTESWGRISLQSICAHLGRSENAVKVRANRMHLGAFLDAGDYVTLSQLIQAVTGSTAAYTYKQTSWVKNRRLPVRTKRVGSNSFRVIYLDEFWKWAEKNRSFLDFSKMEPLALGKEPAWVEMQRKNDFGAYSLQRKDRWTPEEDSRLIMLLRQHKYGYAELSEMLRRSAGAIQRRCMDLGIKERPLRESSHGNVWSESDYHILADGIRRGESYTMIGNKIGKSEKAVRGKVYFTYLTENADKVRSMLGNGEWGDHAPIPTVRQGVTLSRTRTEIKKDLSALVGLLKYRMNQLGYDPYWQRFMCMKWDDLEGCRAGCTDCDDCTSFERIKPQYCARCGGTFYEREQNKICKSCRIARKRAAQRKWARENGK